MRGWLSAAVLALWAALAAVLAYHGEPVWPEAGLQIRFVTSAAVFAGAWAVLLALAWITWTRLRWQGLAAGAILAIVLVRSPVLTEARIWWSPLEYVTMLASLGALSGALLAASRHRPAVSVGCAVGVTILLLFLAGPALPAPPLAGRADVTVVALFGRHDALRTLPQLDFTAVARLRQHLHPRLAAYGWRMQALGDELRGDGDAALQDRQHEMSACRGLGAHTIPVAANPPIIHGCLRIDGQGVAQCVVRADWDYGEAYTWPGALDTLDQRARWEFPPIKENLQDQRMPERYLAPVCRTDDAGQFTLRLNASLAELRPLVLLAIIPGQDHYEPVHVPGIIDLHQEVTDIGVIDLRRL